ncbi:SpoIIE family protein phosphatase [Streptomyces tropicalis]|uniref:SpoIIE family protein phosphatase n=1 Tax=Streptomyces tropicalis TaxID=3034234 RepID=A0ABT6A3D7_9ACTN|nr:SpoIIE family protein phosphatase [Streptomyces tropicalis]MDF3299147.1 SpoIIE family protein phosphatase [Streptomyces tropicalis]
MDPAAREQVAPCEPPGSGSLDAIGTGAYTVDEQGYIVAVNARAEQLLARSAPDLVGYDAHELLHRTRYGQPMPRSRCPMRRALLSGRVAQGLGEWFARGDASLLPVAWLLTPYRLDDGRAGMLALFHALPEEGVPRVASSGEAVAVPLSELERLALLAETTTQLTSTLDVDEAMDRLVRLVLPRLADWAVIDLITEGDDVSRALVAHAGDDGPVARVDLQGPLPPVSPRSPMPLSRALRGVASTVVGPETYQSEPDSGIAVEQRRLFTATGMHSAVIAPIRSLREVLGALTLGRSERSDPFTAADLPLLEDITHRTGVALENARLYQRQRKIAETMQRHLLPQLPRVTGLEMTARYEPSPDASQVGGDWYDAFSLGEGITALAIGDVVGHDLDAAAGMAQLRNMLRAYAWSEQRPPSTIVDWLDQATRHISEVTMATLIFARLNAGEAGQWQLTWANAGHPPPLLISADGCGRFLTEAHGILLGARSGRTRRDASVAVPAGSTLVLYTDGLVESPGRSIDEGLERLRRNAGALAARPLESFTDQLLDRVRPADNDDDVALLALRTPGPAG